MATSGHVNSSGHSTSLVQADCYQVACHSSVSTSQHVTAFSGMCAVTAFSDMCAVTVFSDMCAVTAFCGSVSTSQHATAFSGICAAWHCGRAWWILVIIRNLIFCPILPIFLHAAWTRLSDALLFCNDGLCQLLNAVPLP